MDSVIEQSSHVRVERQGGPHRGIIARQVDDIKMPTGPQVAAPSQPPTPRAGPGGPRARPRIPPTGAAGRRGISRSTRSPLAVQLEDYPYLHSTRAELLRRLGRAEDARVAFRRALDLTRSEPERRFLQRRLDQLT
jgi:hypothetical protein